MIYQVEIEIGVRQKPVDNSSIIRSQTLTREAQTIVNAAGSNEAQLRNALSKLDQAIVLNPNNDQAILLKDKLEKLTLEIKAKAGKDGKMFGAISTKQIVEEYKKQFDIELDKRKFVDNKNIVSLGYSKLKIELYKNVIATIIVHVSEI